MQVDNDEKFARPLKGAVLVIGSLLWEDHLKQDKKDNIRSNWRNERLNNSESEFVPVHVPIYYGRFSQKRQVYTMTFRTKEGNFLRNHGKFGSQRAASIRIDNELELGKAYCIPLKNEVITIDNLYSEINNLAVAEGIYTTSNEHFYSGWGRVLLLMNPKNQLNWFEKIKGLVKSTEKEELSYNEKFIKDLFLNKDLPSHPYSNRFSP
jgi:hypothetical protein